MDSPYLQASSSFGYTRPRANSNLSAHSSDSRGIRKRSLSRSRSISLSQAERLERTLRLSPESTGSSHWITPQPSPQLQPFVDTYEADPTWAIPTPPRSDSCVPTLTVDAANEPLPVSTGPECTFNFNAPATTSADMGSLGYLLPSQYGHMAFEDNTSDPSSFSSSQNLTPALPQVSSSADYGFSQPTSSGPPSYSSRASHIGPSVEIASLRRSMSSGYSPSVNNQIPRRISSPLPSLPGHGRDYSGFEYPMMPAQTSPPVHGLSQSAFSQPRLSSMSSQYSTSLERSPSLYDANGYNPAFTSASPPQAFQPAHSLSYPPPVVSSNVGQPQPRMNGETQVRVLNQRPKPQCWEHGCNGRQFSTFSNLLRHQREKSGTAAKSYCPKCGAEFTRTTARNGHLAHEKCTKQRRSSDDK
ncbi:hypothetical protein H2203_007528 [Taxawa tesnikishii (nom. ined.)]|nr:hypothetical protein H2203_007528 [Dothideales sp. JES 119]